MRVEESIEGAHTRLVLAQTHKGPVAAEYVRLRHRQWNPGFARISEDELARPDRPSLTRQRIDVALVRLAGDSEGTAPLFLRVAEGGHTNVDLARTERGIPVLRIVDTFVPELL